MSSYSCPLASVNGSFQPITGDQQHQRFSKNIHHNLQKGLSNRPDAKLEAARKAFEAVRAGSDEVAVGALRELINVIDSEQREDDGILKDDAEDLTDAAREIINLLAIKRESAVAYTS